MRYGLTPIDRAIFLKLVVDDRGVLGQALNAVRCPLARSNGPGTLITAIPPGVNPLDQSLAGLLVRQLAIRVLAVMLRTQYQPVEVREIPALFILQWLDGTRAVLVAAHLADLAQVARGVALFQRRCLANSC